MFLSFFAVERREFCKARRGCTMTAAGRSGRNRAHTCGLPGQLGCTLDRSTVRHPILFSSRVPV
jgi:hypothetical protein